MAEGKPSTPAKTSKKSVWTMDVMILANMNEISKSIDEYAMRVESGEIRAMLGWKAGLKQFYRNIKSFFDDDLLGICSDSFEYLDGFLDLTSRTIPATKTDIKKAYGVMDNLNELLYEARNQLFMKFIETMNPNLKTLQYMNQGLSKGEKDKRMNAAKVKEEKKANGGHIDAPSN